MATEAQIAANRLNAQKSTGPRTEEGKAVSSQNAVKHGLLSQAPVFPGEDPGEFQAFLDETIADLKPAGAVQRSLAERIAHLQWKLKRIPHIEAQYFNQIAAEETLNRNCYHNKKLPPIPGPDTAEVMMKSFKNSSMLEKMQVYEQRLDRALRGHFKEFRDMQKHQREQAEYDREQERTGTGHFSGKMSEASTASQHTPRPDVPSLRQTNKRSQFPGSSGQIADISPQELTPPSRQEHHGSLDVEPISMKPVPQNELKEESEVSSTRIAS